MQKDLTTIFSDPLSASITVLGRRAAVVNRAEMVLALVEVRVHLVSLVGCTLPIVEGIALCAIFH